MIDSGKRRANGWAALLAVALVIASGVATAARKALVIGNDTYEAIDTLRNARADADSMAAALMRAGYAVRLEKDRSWRQMRSAIREFGASLSGEDEVVFYFSGHGVQIKGMNYLLPVDVQAQSEDQVRDDSIALSDVLGGLARQKPAFTLAIIDACRDNPFPGTGHAIGGRGLTGVAGTAGQMVIYSAGDGQQALDHLGALDMEPNGVFTRVFIREMARPGLPIRDVVSNVRDEVHRMAQGAQHDQVPAIYDQAPGRFYFYAPKSVTSVAVGAAAPPPDSNARPTANVATAERVSALAAERLAQLSQSRLPEKRESTDLLGPEVAARIEKERARSAPTKSRSASARCPANSLAPFPWPKPPEPSVLALVPPRLLFGTDSGPKTLADVARRLESAIAAAGYLEPRYLGAGCNGFAVALDLEYIDDDGTRKGGTTGFSQPGQQEVFGLATYIKRLFYAPPGFYRQIVIVVSDLRLESTASPPALAELRSITREGRSTLSPDLGSAPYSQAYEIHALVYEFEKGPRDGSVRLLPPEGRLPATVHLVKARLFN